MFGIMFYTTVGYLLGNKTARKQLEEALAVGIKKGLGYLQNRTDKVECNVSECITPSAE